ncbi:TPA: formimidoylglutamase [Staphylococcus aureus]|nr:formimidoylglutamase [Staphylococcus aureus]HEI5465358.1 formimidoylglutamase [Staphylococcus aureus]HEJ0664482.1 formimidoylglutamase [Staphylococcus aureus]HEJ0665814.1 formimidoylglutamase [Staphylococcus aureus]
MYKQGEPNLWTGRLDSETDPKKFRHFQTVTFEDLSKLEKSSMPSGVGILGYAVDKGVALNKGRIGAKEGPDAIKQAFAGLPDLNQCETLVDYGNVYHDHEQLIDTQKEFAMLAAKSIANHRQTFLLGGGHDIAYAQYLATRKVYPTQSIGVINIDAHFDTRAEQQSTSGTSFRQILEEDENTDYLVLGIAQGGNTQSLFDYAKEKKIDYVFADELLSHVSPTIKDMIERFVHEHDVIMFTICMDVIDSAFAPGVSAPAVLGLYPHTVLELAKRIIPSDKVSSVSIAEMNPTYDADNRTAKLVANLVHHFLK